MKDDISVGDYILFDALGTVNVGYVISKGESHYRVKIPDMMGTYGIQVTDGSITKLDPLKAYALLTKQQEQTS